MGKTRILSSTLALGAAAVLLAGCSLLPGLGGDDRPDPGSTSDPSPSSSAESGGDGPSQADPSIVVLGEDDFVPYPEFTTSTPAGTWSVGVGIPAGFPVGVPVYRDRWIDGNAYEFESQGRYGFSAMFWGGYAEMDQLAERLRELGFEVEDQSDDTKRIIVADSDRYRVIVNGTESAVNPGETEVLDPAYTIAVVFQD